MTRPPGLYSRVIAWLKVLLPLTALILMSTLFLLPRTAPETRMPPFAGTTEGQLGEGMRQPYFSGVSEGGDLMAVTADAVRTEAGGRILADRPGATLTLAGDGGRIRIDAAMAVMDETAGTIRFDGDVRIESSAGYSMRTPGLVAALDGAAAESTGPVEADGPAGRLRAGRLKVEPREGADPRLLFTDGVKLIYDPQSQ